MRVIVRLGFIRKFRRSRWTDISILSYMRFWTGQRAVLVSGCLSRPLRRNRRDALGDNLIGVCLHGSAAMGCFNPAKSDLDLQNPEDYIEKMRGTDRDLAAHAAMCACGHRHKAKKRIKTTVEMIISCK